MRLENSVLASYFHRVVPADQQKADDDESGKGGRKGKKAQSKEIKKTVELTLDQKHTVANNEIEVLKEGTEEARKQAETLLDKLKAMLENADISTSEVKKDYYEFKRDVVGGERNFRAGKSVTEKVMRFLEEKMREKDAIIEKLSVKNTALNAQTNKLTNALQQKEEAGEALHVIDFDQLTIENQQYNEKIDERNNELIKLKLTTTNIVQKLNNSKKKLNNLTSESVWLRKSIEEKNDSLAKSGDEQMRL